MQSTNIQAHSNTLAPDEHKQPPVAVRGGICTQYNRSNMHQVGRVRRSFCWVAAPHVCKPLRDGRWPGVAGVRVRAQLSERSDSRRRREALVCPKSLLVTTHHQLLQRPATPRFLLLRPICSCQVSRDPRRERGRHIHQSTPPANPSLFLRCDRCLSNSLPCITVSTVLADWEGKLRDKPSEIQRWKSQAPVDAHSPSMKGSA